MAKTTSAYRPKGYRLESKKILPADTTATVLVAAAGADDSIIKSLVITSDDTSARDVRLFLYDATTDFQIATINVPIASGTDGTTISVDALAGAFLVLDDAGKKVLPLEAGWSLRAAMLATITAAKTVTVTAILEDF